jgi:hypothetical protein
MLGFYYKFQSVDALMESTLPFVQQTRWGYPPIEHKTLIRKNVVLSQNQDISDHCGVGVRRGGGGAHVKDGRWRVTDWRWRVTVDRQDTTGGSQGRISRVIHGLPKASLGPAMT